MSKSISRVQYQTVIYLLSLLPMTSSDLPFGLKRATLVFTSFLVLLPVGFT